MGILGAGMLLAGCLQREEGGGAVVIAEEQKQAEWVSLMPEEGAGDWETALFGGEGEIAWEEGMVKMTRGVELTGVRWEGDLPESPYEIRLEARKTLGDDFFCGLTVPVRGKDGCVTLIVGGWGGGTVGISSIDTMDASENGTTTFHRFERDQWYRIRMEVRENHLKAWIDDEEVVSVDTTGREIGLKEGMIDLCAPLGLASFQTDVEMRGVEWRKLGE